MGNRSAGSSYEYRSRESVSVSFYRLDQELEGVSLLENAGSFGSQESSGQEFSFVGLVSEADLSPLYSRANCSLCGVVGWFYSFVLDEREQAVPVVQ